MHQLQDIKTKAKSSTLIGGGGRCERESGGRCRRECRGREVQETVSSFRHQKDSV